MTSLRLKARLFIKNMIFFFKRVNYYNMKIEKTSSGYTILESGSIITYDQENNDILFSITMDESFSFSLSLKFTSNSEKQYQLQQSVSENTITLNCINFDNPFGTGTNKPIELATFQNKKIYINFWVTALGNKGMKQISYTFYYEQ